MAAEAEHRGEGLALAFCIAGAFVAMVLVPELKLLDLKACAAFLLCALFALGLALQWLPLVSGGGSPPHLRLRDWGLPLILALMGLAAFASWLASPYRGLSDGPDRLVLAGLGLAMAVCVAPEAWSSRLLPAWRFSALLLAFYALAQRLGLDPVQAAVQAGSRSRSMASFGNPDYLAAFFCLSWPLFLAWCGWKRNGAVFILLCALACTGSRAALVALGLQGLLAINLTWKAAPTPSSGIVGQALRSYGSGRAKRKRPFLLPSIVAFFVYLSVWDWSRPTLRLGIWKASLDLWLQRPWLGWGPGVFVPAFQEHAASGLDAALKASNQYVEDPHQLFLSIACAGGLLGLLLFGAALYYCLRCLLGSDRPDAAVLGLAAAGLLIQSQADRFFFQAGVFVPFCVLCGLLARPAAQAQVQDPAPASAGLWQSRGVGFVISLALLFLANVAFQSGIVPIFSYSQAVGTGLDAGVAGLDFSTDQNLGAPVSLTEAAGTDPLALEQEGDALASQRRFPEAAKDFARAMDLQPSLGRAQNLGNCLIMSGDAQGAEAAFRRGLALEPKNADAHFCLAYALYGEKKLGPALAELDEALKLDPNDASALQLKRQILP